MKVLFLITARGGSKGVPGKNLRRIGGISLVGYKAISARKSQHCARLIISTDSAEIQDDARRHGVEVPFTRPAELASDTAKSGPVILHAMEWIEREGRERYDAVMLLQPSSPFSKADDYDKAVELMRQTGANAVVGVRQVERPSTVVGAMDDNYCLTEIVDKMNAIREKTGLRQTLPKEVTMNGTFYLFRWDYFKKYQWIFQDRTGVYGHLMDRYHSVDIDDLADLHWAEFMMEKGYVTIDHWREYG
ncbi:MAG: acylneuraminate cytidylyltransferase family protein [Rhodocyclaceae bacterium]|nr:acylneuraminate cytidylyltransferase family protein [Rhodocyclaceae bacterium]